MLSLTKQSFVLVFLLLTSTLTAKEGSYYLSHFEIPEDLGSSQNNTMVQDATDRLIIANREKIIIYDGENWSTVATPSTPVSLHFDVHTQTVYVGCLHHFGYLNEVDSITPYFSPLSHVLEEEPLPVSQIESTDSTVVFMNESVLYIYQKGDSLTTLRPRQGRSFTQMIQNQNQIILSTSDGALSLLQEKELKQVGHFPHQSSVVSHFSDDKSLIIVNEAGELYYFNGSKYVRIWLKKPYLKNHTIIGLLRLRNNKLLIATDDEGAIVIDRKTGRIDANINYANGLPDDNLFFMYHDRKGNAWFGHEYGLTKLDIHIPFEDFSHFEGLKGHIHDVTYFQGRLYVATSVGLFHLSEKEDYALVEQSSVMNRPETPKKRSRSRRRKTKKKKEPQKVVLSIKKVFEKDLVIQSACLDLQIINNSLIAVTEKGVFNLSKTKTEKIFEEEVSLVTYDLSGTEKKVILLDEKLLFTTLILDRRNKWRFAKNKGLPLPFEPTYLFHHESNEYWVANNKQAARFQLEEDTLQHYEAHVIENPFSEPLWVQRYQEQLILFTNSKAYRFDYEQSRFEVEATLTEDMEAAERILHSQSGITWFKHDNRWKNLSFIETRSKKFRFVSIVHGIKDIYLDQSQSNYWVVDMHDNLLYFSALKKLSINTEFGTYLASVEDKSGQFLNEKELKLNHKNNALKLTYYTPFYLPSYEVLYRYKVNGQDNEWTAWTTESVLHLNGLRPNKYQVEVESKTLFNDSIKGASFSFKIKPPYWQTTWFYLLEISFFMGLILVSARVSKSQSTRKRIIVFRKAMIFMTFIIFVEYFEVIGQSLFDMGDSPVVSFVVQVLLAMAVFPLERFISLKMKLLDF